MHNFESSGFLVRLATAVIVLLSFISAVYGVGSRYFLNDDLPAHVAVVKELSEFGTAKYGNPYFSNIGLPDLHAGPYYLIVYLIYITTKPHLISLGVGYDQESIVSSFIVLGMVNLLIFNFSIIAITRRIFSKSYFTLVSLIAIYFLSDVPLIRWAGNISLHGVSYQFYFPQFFALSILVLIVHLNELFLEKSRKSIFILVYVFSFVLFLSHLLTGLLLIFLLLIRISLDKDSSLVKKIQYVLLVNSVPLVSVLTWGLFPVRESLTSTNAHVLLFLMNGVCLLITLFLHRFDIFHEISKIFKLASHIFPALTLFLSIMLSVYLFANLDQWSTYFSFVNVNLWWISYLPLIPAILLIFSKDVLDNTLLKLFLFWSLGSLLLYFVGVSGLHIKIYWRFLFLAKLPLSILLSYAILLVFGKYKQYRHHLLLFIPIVALFATFQLMPILTSKVATYFKKLPLEYSIAAYFADKADLKILSDPYTSYFISGLTSNKAYIVDVDRLSDYDQHLFSEKEPSYLDFISSKTSSDMLDKAKAMGVDYFVNNKTIGYDTMSKSSMREPLPTNNNHFDESELVPIVNNDDYAIYKF